MTNRPGEYSCPVQYARTIGGGQYSIVWEPRRPQEVEVRDNGDSGRVVYRGTREQCMTWLAAR